MARYGEIMLQLSNKLPQEIVNKIIYTHKGLRTPSGSIMSKFLERVREKFYKFESIIMLKIVKCPIEYLEFEDEYITNVLLVYYNKYRRCLFINL